jgi:hypothetical protein
MTRKPAQRAAATDAATAERLTVIGPAKGRWRAGRRFGQEPVTIPVTALTEAEIAAITSDPELTVIVE